MEVGDCFNSFAAFKEVIDRRHEESHEKLVIGKSSNSVKSTNAKLKGRFKFREELVYTNVNYRCIYEGAFHTKGHSRESISLKNGCPVHVKLKADRICNQLRVVSVILEHNHVLPRRSAGAYTQDRKLTEAEQTGLSKLIRTGAPVRNSVDYVSSEHEVEVIDDELLIGAIQTWPGLWDRDEYPNNRSYVPTAWDNVAKEVGAEAEDCKKRWIQLRDYFVRITRQKRAADEQGVAFQSKPWYLYEELMFLYPIISKKSDMKGVIGRRNIENDEIIDNEGEEIPCENGYFSPLQSFCSDDYDEFETSTASPTTSTTHQKSSHKKRKLDAYFACSTSDEEEDEAADDSNNLFFKSLLPSMKNLDDIKVMEFRLEVQSLLLKYLKSAKQGDGDCAQQESASTSGVDFKQ